jgi:hypothetical protein
MPPGSRRWRTPCSDDGRSPRRHSGPASRSRGTFEPRRTTPRRHRVAGARARGSSASRRPVVPPAIADAITEFTARYAIGASPAVYDGRPTASRASLRRRRTLTFRRRESGIRRDHLALRAPPVCELGGAPLRAAADPARDIARGDARGGRRGRDARWFASSGSSTGAGSRAMTWSSGSCTMGHGLLRDHLGLDPLAFRLVCIPPDVYMRIGVERGWGRSDKWTHFDGYRSHEGRSPAGHSWAAMPGSAGSPISAASAPPMHVRTPSRASRWSPRSARRATHLNISQERTRPLDACSAVDYSSLANRPSPR